LNFEDEISLRGVDCNIPILINRRLLIRDVKWSFEIFWKKLQTIYYSLTKWHYLEKYYCEEETKKSLHNMATCEHKSGVNHYSKEKF
jgi:hypothetical protein